MTPRLSRSIHDLHEETIGPWLSAALDDPKVCAAMKDDIEVWFASLAEITPLKTYEIESLEKLAWRCSDLADIVTPAGEPDRLWWDRIDALRQASLWLNLIVAKAEHDSAWPVSRLGGWRRFNQAQGL